MSMKKSICVLILSAMLLTLSSCKKGQTEPTVPEQIAVTEEDTTVSPAAYKRYENISAVLILASPSDSPNSEERTSADSFDRCTAREEFRFLHAEKIYAANADSFYAKRKIFDTAIQNGSNLVFTVGNDFSAVAAELAEEYPDISFFCSDDIADAPDNIHRYTAKIHEAFYLAGIAAASKTATNRIAMIAEAGTSKALALNLANSFALGAQTVSDSVSVYLKTADETTETVDCIRYLSAFGCDIFAGNFQSAAVYDEADRLGRSIFSYNLTAIPENNESIIGRINIDYAAYFTACLRSSAEEQAQTDYCGDLKDGAVQFMMLPEHTNEHLDKRLQQAEKAIADRTFSIFSGFKIYFDKNTDDMTIDAAPLQADGALICEAGENIPDDQASRESMDYYVDGLSER